jgi:hypothetical protein
MAKKRLEPNCTQAPFCCCFASFMLLNTPRGITSIKYGLRHLCYTVLSKVDFRKKTSQNVAVTRNLSLLKRNVHSKHVCSNSNDETVSTK